MGVLYAHPANPNKDYQKARAHFAMLIEQFPKSMLAQRARVWVEVLHAAMQLPIEVKIVEPEEKKVPPPKKASPPKETKAEALVREGETLMSQGDFSGALEAYTTALLSAPRTPPGDRALFDIGLLYAHRDNPNKDFQKSLALFRRLEEHFPESSYTQRAWLWIDLLEMIEKGKQVDIEIEQKKQELSQ
jgi:tetratricopeptide (TPR) repeat protein